MNLKRINLLYHLIKEGRGQLAKKARAREDPKWDYTYWIEHFHQMFGLLQEFQAKYDASITENKSQTKEIIMGDQYNTGQAGAVGPGAHAHNITFQQVWNQSASNIDLKKLSHELAQLRPALRDAASEPEHDIAIGEVAAAEKAAQEGNGPKALGHLKKAGKWTFDIATKIGTGVATAALKVALGL